MNVYDLLPLTFVIDFKSEFIWDQLDLFKGALKIIENNLEADVNEINRKLQCF